MEKLAGRYNKPLILAEVAHGYRTIENGLYDKPQEELSGFESSPAGQKKVMELVMCITANITGNKGLGVFYWEPFCMPGGMDDKWALSMSLMDESGKAMEGLKAFRENPYDFDGAEYVKLYSPEKIKLTRSMTLDMTGVLQKRLPNEIRALRFDGNIDKLPVEWDCSTELKSGTINNITGTCNGQTVIARVEVVNDGNSVNLIINGTFNDNLESWDIQKQDCVDVQVREKIADELPYDTYHYLYVKGNDKFLFNISQKIRINRNGKYRFSLSYMGDNTTGVNVQMYITTADGNQASRAIFPEELWHERSIDMEVTQIQGNITDIEMEIGVRMDSPISFGAMKDIKLVCN